MNGDGAAGGRNVRVVVADDQALVRGGIVMLLSGSDQIEVVAEAADGESAVRLAREHGPDVVVMDLRMPGSDGIEATRSLVEDGVDGSDLTKVLVLTTFDDDASVIGALRVGASGFLVKDEAPAHLVEAVLAVAAGHAWIDRSVTAQVLRALAEVPRIGVAGDARIAALTARERELLVLMASGRSNAEIARKLVLSDATVRTHVSRILMKTGARNRAEAVVLAYQSGLVRAGT